MVGLITYSEADYANDPGYVYISGRHFSRSGVSAASRAFQDALNLFPKNAPPLNPSRRMKVWNAAPC